MVKRFKRSNRRIKFTRRVRRGVKSRRGKSSHNTRQTIGSRPGFGMVRQPFAPNLYTQFSYTESLQLIQTLPGVPGQFQYRANGLYDPRVIIGGKQPRYYDSLLGTNNGTAPYDHYRVHSAKIVVTIWPESPSAGSSNGIIAVIPERSTVTAPSTFDEISERPYCRKVAMTSLGSYKPRKIKHYVKMKTILGHKDLSDVDSTAALYNALPNEEVYFNIYTCAVDASDNLSPRIEVCITYYAQLYNLVDVADS